MIHHISLGTNDVARSRRFYTPVPELFGYSLVKENDRALDYGISDFLFSLETPVDGRPAVAGNGTHIALRAPFRKTVDEFYKKALENGGRDAGAPGLRPEYDKHYYGAFVLDPDGNKIEAVTFSAE